MPASLHIQPFHFSMKYSVPVKQLPSPTHKIWWSNAIFFVLVHLAALAGFIYNPIWEARRATLVMAFFIWQLADFGSVHYLRVIVCLTRSQNYHWLPPSLLTQGILRVSPRPRCVGNSGVISVPGIHQGAPSILLFDRPHMITCI